MFVYVYVDRILNWYNRNKTTGIRMTKSSHNGSTAKKKIITR